MKNVAGYDVSRLIAGSWGVLGVICEVSLKVLAAPRRHGDTGIRVGRATRSRGACALARPAPAAARERLVRRASAHAPGGLARGGVQARGTARRQRRGSGRGARLLGERPRSSARVLCARRRRAGARRRRCGDCRCRRPRRRFSLPAGNSSNGAARSAGGAPRRRRREVRAAAAGAGGHATLVRAADKSAGAFAPVGSALMRIHRALKEAFDPDAHSQPGPPVCRTFDAHPCKPS